MMKKYIIIIVSFRTYFVDYSWETDPLPPLKTDVFVFLEEQATLRGS